MSDENPLASLPDDQLIAAYREFRAKRDDEKAAFTERQKPTLRAMERIENELQRRMQERGISSISAREIGTAYQSSRATASCKDREAFFNYLRETDEWDLADIKPNATAARKFSEDHDGELPPGVKLTIENRVNIKGS